MMTRRSIGSHGGKQKRALELCACEGSEMGGGGGEDWVATGG